MKDGSEVLLDCCTSRIPPLIVLLLLTAPENNLSGGEHSPLLLPLSVESLKKEIASDGGDIEYPRSLTSEPPPSFG